MENCGIMDTALRPYLEAVTEYYRENYDPESSLFKTTLLSPLEIDPNSVTDYEEMLFRREMNAQAESLRSRGNQCFKAENFEEALQLYTRSISAAIHGPLASLAYNNRSATLFLMGFYEDSIVDIERAVESGYPNKQKLYSLYFRKAKCLKFLNKDYAGCLADVFKAIRDHNNNDKSMTENVESEIEKAVPDLTVKNHPISNNWTVPELSYGQNHEVPCFSSAVSLMHNKELGRHIVANRKINTGDVLIVEEGSVSTLFAKNVFNFCHLCFKHCNTLIPCLKCGLTMYCNESCRDSAWTFPHHFECRTMNLIDALKCFDNVFRLNVDTSTSDLKYSANAIPLIMIRIIKQIGIDHIKKIVLENLSIQSLCPGNPRTKGFTKGKFQTNTFEALFSNDDQIDALVGNKDTTDNIVAAFRHCSMFKIPYDEWLPMAAVFYKIDLLVCCQFKVVNCLKVNFKAGYKNWLKTLYLGFGFYFARGLVNHSCAPNMYEVMHGTTVVYRAMRPVSEGEQLTISYSNIPASLIGYDERQEFLLKSYHFKCRCIACVGSFPKLECFPRYPQDDQMDQWFIDAGIEKKICSMLKQFCNFNLPATKKMLPKLLNLLQCCHASGQTSNQWYYNLQQTIKNHFNTEGSCIFYNDAKNFVDEEFDLQFAMELLSLYAH